MPKWIEDRKDLLLKDNPNMPETEAWAIATNQYKKVPSHSKHKSDMNKLSEVTLAAFHDEIAKIAFATVKDVTRSVKNSVNKKLPALVSKPTVQSVETPKTTLDPTIGSKSISPPPVTV